MATWADVENYVAKNYKYERMGDGALKLLFDVGNGRSQVVVVRWAGPTPEQATWVDFHTPIGEFEAVNLTAAVKATLKYVVGGVSTLNGVVTMRTSIPLANLDPNEIDDPINLLAHIGDAHEDALTGGDVY